MDIRKGFIGMLRVTVIDYGVGNLLSVCRAVEHCGAEAVLVNSPQEIEKAERLILPGVGAFGDAMQGLRKRQLVGTIRAYAETGRPFLGICLGMQLFFSESVEGGKHKGLDLLKGKVTRLPNNVKVPHMGWNTLENIISTPLTQGISKGDYVYFVHSFAPEPQDPHVTVATSFHGRDFPAIVKKGNIWGTQFHPEKSGTVGSKILKNFVELL